ncbi:hypothetical protein BXT90_06880 [Corynebacterium amycolatum]|uniref:hypothetical protein n=1 Tax=Corynebacterium TaxID=1716 RepID=UPI000976EA48|nr:MULTISPECIES: hypothetical protein [Corynebacterium]MDK8849360.1 hypothetical protein [Corynebacterium sp. MSK019]OMQ07728.1 hypothetical protein BXT90_06880 [Corynebacterium amycolatum]
MNTFPSYSISGHETDRADIEVSGTQVLCAGTLFALDPVIGAILGWAFSGDRVTWSMALGIVLIAVAGAIITWRGARESRELRGLAQ